MNLSLSSLFSHVSLHGRFHKLQEILPFILVLRNIRVAGTKLHFCQSHERTIRMSTTYFFFQLLSVVFGLKETNLKLKRCIQYAIAGVRLYRTFLREFLRETIAATEWTKRHFYVLKLQIYANDRSLFKTC